MGRTTIDGLSVRSSGPRPVPEDVSFDTARHKAMDIQPRRSRQAMSDVVPVRENQPKQVVGNDFLSPVQGFDFGEPDNSLVTADEADWSDLLDRLDADTEADLELSEDELRDEDTKKSKRKQSKEDKKNRKKNGKKKHKHIVLKIFLLLLLIAGVVVFVWGDAIISKLTGGRSGFWDAIASLVSEEIPFETDENGRTNVLIFGTEGYDMSGSSGDGQHDGAQLTDSIMVISFDQETKDVALLSLPRDLKVPKACYAGKVNEIFTCNNPDDDDEEAGAEAMMTEIGKILGIDFQYWAHVNWSSLIDIINTLGGITITLDEDINDYYYTGAVAQAGVPITIDGEQALGLARARHGTNGGDFTRGNTQQKIVEGIVQKVVNDGIGITEALNILNILGDNLRSNFSTDNVKSGLSLLSGFDMANIRNVPLVDYDTETYYVTTDTINGISYVVPSAGANNYTQIKKYVAKMFSSNPAVREDAQIAIYNATETSGLAGNEQGLLETDGYTVSGIGDAPAGSCAARYCLYALSEEKSATKAILEERYGVAARGGDELPQGIWPGETTDFILVIGKAGVE